MIILVGHYAFHHLGQSFDYFRHVSEGIPTILYESLVNDNWATTYQKRQRMLIFDILMNYGFDHLYDNNWVRAAAHENANYFQVHYINKNHLDDAVTITPIKGSNNSIVHY